jgi:hypothetical protein
VVFTNKDAPDFGDGLPVAKMATVIIHFSHLPFSVFPTHFHNSNSQA